MERILVVNVNWLGDVIFSSPVFKALKEAYPQAKISCLAVPRVCPLLENIAHVDEIIVYEEEGRHRHPFGKLHLIFELRRKRFDCAFLLHRSWTRAALVYGASVKKRVGYDTKNRGKLLTHITEPEPEDHHRSDYYLRVIQSFGVTVHDRHCSLTVSPQSDSEMAGILAERHIHPQDYLIVVNPGGNWDLKRWPVEYFLGLVRKLAQMPDTKIVITGAPKDQILLAKAERWGCHNIVSLAGKTDLKQLLALMKRANLVISADSGPMHLASGVGSDVIGLFGPTRPEITGPRGLGVAHVLQQDVGCNREACYHLRCPDNICMQSLSVDYVIETIRKIRH